MLILYTVAVKCRLTNERIDGWMVLVLTSREYTSSMSLVRTAYGVYALILPPCCPRCQGGVLGHARPES